MQIHNQIHLSRYRVMVFSTQHPIGWKVLMEIDTIVDNDVWWRWEPYLIKLKYLQKMYNNVIMEKRIHESRSKKHVYLHTNH
jgi:hypothetical protein